MRVANENGGTLTLQKFLEIMRPRFSTYANMAVDYAREQMLDEMGAERDEDEGEDENPEDGGEQETLLREYVISDGGDPEDLDVDGEGGTDVVELAMMVASELPALLLNSEPMLRSFKRFVTDLILNILYRVMDASNDGFVSIAEIENFRTIVDMRGGAQTKSLKERMTAIFLLFDMREDDGETQRQITMDEAVVALRKVVGLVGSIPVRIADFLQQEVLRSDEVRVIIGKTIVPKVFAKIYRLVRNIGPECPIKKLQLSRDVGVWKRQDLGFEHDDEEDETTAR